MFCVGGPSAIKFESFKAIGEWSFEIDFKGLLANKGVSSFLRNIQKNRIYGYTISSSWAMSKKTFW